MSEPDTQKAQSAPQEPSLATGSQLTSRWWKSQRAQRSLITALVFALISTCIWWEFFAPYIRTDDARVAATTVSFAPRGMGGQMIDLLVDEGDRVKNGQLLARLDQRIARAHLKRARAQDRWMSRELARIQEQAKGGFTSQRDLDRAICNAKSARADRQLARIALDDTLIKSTLDGVVVFKSAEKGDFLQPGQAAVTIADLDSAWIAVNIEETYARRLRAGQSVMVKIDEGGELEGHVGEILNSTASQFALIPADSGSGNYTKVVQRIPIKVRLLPSAGHALRIGQSAEIRIRIKKGVQP